MPEDLTRGLRVRDQVLLALGGDALTRDQLAERVDAKRGTLNTTLARLTTDGIVTKWDDGKWALRTTTTNPLTPTVVVVGVSEDSRTTGRQLSSLDLDSQPSSKGDE